MSNENPQGPLSSNWPAHQDRPLAEQNPQLRWNPYVEDPYNPDPYGPR